MSNHEIGLTRVMCADAVRVALWVVGVGPYFLARLYHAAWYWQIAAGLLGFLAVYTLVWALARPRARWVGETYRLAKGHPDLTFDARLRSRLANAIGLALFLPVAAASAALFFLPVGRSVTSPLAAVLLVTGLAFLLMAALRLAVYAGVKAADRMAAERRKQKREGRGRNK